MNDYLSIIVASHHYDEYPIPKTNHVCIDTFWPGPFDLQRLAECVQGNHERVWGSLSGVPSEIEKAINSLFGMLMGTPENLAAFDKDRYNKLVPEAVVLNIRGEEGPMLQAFYAFVKTISEGPHGADDDTYDYWPDAFGIAHDWAMGIDTHRGTTECMDHLYNVIGPLDVDEFTLPERTV